MNKKNWLVLVGCIVLTEAAGVVGSLFTTPAIRSGWYGSLVRPEFAPPNWLFGPVWITLYMLMGVSLFLVWKRKFVITNPLAEQGRPWNKLSEKLWRGSWSKRNIIAVFSVQLLLNILWSVVFFGMQDTGLALAVIASLWVSIVFMIMNFYRVSRTAAWLNVPYLLWVSFATYLNYSFWILN